MINANPRTVHSGQSTTVSWDPRGNTGCHLSAQLGGIAVTTQGSQSYTPTGQTTISITCDNNLSTSTTVMILPTIYEN